MDLGNSVVLGDLACPKSKRMSRIECSRSQYLPLLWPVQQSWAAVEHNDVILTLGLLTGHLRHQRGGWVGSENGNF